MRPHFARVVSLVLGLVLSGAAPAQAQVSLCGGPDAVPLDSSLVNFGLTAPITLADLDGDGTLEILSGDAWGYVHIWHADGSRFKHWPKHTGGSISGPPSVGDIDGDGRIDVVATSYQDVAVNAWRVQGGRLHGFPKRIGAASGVDFLQGAAMLTDLNGDGVLDVVAGSVQGIVHAFTDPFHDEVTGWPVNGGQNFQVTPTSTDFDGDGTPEVVLGGSSLMGIVRADGSWLPGWPRTPGTSHVTPVLGDLDGDGTPEVILADYSTLRAFHSNGSPVFQWALRNDYFYYSSIALGDVTGDGLPEIFVGTQLGYLYAFSGGGSLVSGWPVDTGDDLDISPLIVDLDGDGWRDVLQLTSDGVLHAYGAYGATICPPLALGTGAVGAPAVGDLDGDGLGEVIVSTYGDAKIFRLGLPGPWTPSRAAWPMALANERHTGELPRF